MLTKVSATIIGLLLVLGLGGTASATPRYPGTDPSITVSAGTVAPGQDFTVRAGGFRAGSTVTVTATPASGSGETATGTADSNGFATVSLDLARAGAYAIVASGVGPDGEPVSVSSSVTVSGGASGSGSSGSSGSSGGDGTSGSSSRSGASALAQTGVDNLATTAWVAFGVLVLGGLLVAVASGRGRTRHQNG